MGCEVSEEVVPRPVKDVGDKVPRPVNDDGER